MNEIKIEKNVPIPPIRSGLAATLRGMKTGDSFVCSKSKRNSILATATRLKIKLATRAVSETEVRVWRVK